MNRARAAIFLGAGLFEGRAPTPSNRTREVGAQQSPATALSIAGESAIHANSMGAAADEANADLRPQERYPTERELELLVPPRVASRPRVLPARRE